ncbi:hypothetical protein LSAT2_025918 [Lamellibrachia satsuma]|nr:hypothetical protein LSAT2_025918 [Lamellibrachia satsuma]
MASQPRFPIFLLCGLLIASCFPSGLEANMQPVRRQIGEEQSSVSLCLLCSRYPNICNPTVACFPNNG